MADAIIDANIDASVVGPDRAQMAAAMLAMKPYERWNVILNIRGRLVANHAGLISGSGFGIPLGGRRFVDARGRSYVAPDATARALSRRQAGKNRTPTADVPQAVDTATGPYRRSYSYQGYSSAFGYVSLPCASSNLQPGVQSNETGYIYTGAFAGPTDSNVDAGLQYSAYSDVFTLYYFDPATMPNPFTSSIDFQCGQNLYMEFSTQNDGLHIYEQGSPVQPSGGPPLPNPYGITYVDTVSNPPWSPNGDDGAGGVVIKRMTTIAQVSESLSDGSYFGLDSSLNPAVGMYNWQIGTNYTAPGELDYPFTTPRGNVQSFPNDDTKVLHQPYSNGGSLDELQGINLHG